MRPDHLLRYPLLRADPYDDVTEDNAKPKRTGTGAWIGRFVYNDGDDFKTATPLPGSPNYETYSKYHLHDD